jgi:hypothetical protein|tara:strand:- start:127 stop:537 length:411 start_codon:yes stop_codon:yes gene_type:complete
VDFVFKYENTRYYYRREKMRKIFVMLAIVSCISFLVQGSFLRDVDAKTYAEHSTKGKVGLVATSVVTSAAYFPFKAAYAVLGGVTSGLTYVVTMAKESETAHSIATKAFTGDWYIHPNILTSHEELNFSGPDDISP